MTPEERDTRLNDLHRKLARRTGNPIYRQNLEALRREIDALEEERDAAETPEAP